MQKTDKFYLGDKVKMKASFKPIDRDGNVVEDMKDKEAIIIGSRDDLLVLDFGENLGFTHYAEMQLPEPTGYGVRFRDCVMVSSLADSDKQNVELVGALRRLAMEKAQAVPRELLRRIQDVSAVREDAISIGGRLVSLEKSIRQLNLEILDLEKQKETISFSSEEISRKAKKLATNPKIKEVYISNEIGYTESLVIKTEDLFYKDNFGGNASFDGTNLGAFIFSIPFDISKSILGINYKKHVNKLEKQHPCLSGMYFCFGDVMSLEVSVRRKESELISLAYSIINFIEEPDYKGPHISIAEFSQAMPVTISVDDDAKYFVPATWADEQWEGDVAKEYAEKLSNME